METARLPHWDRQPRICEQCKKTYTPNNKRQRFCSGTCKLIGQWARVKANRELKAARRYRNLPPL